MIRRSVGRDSPTKVSPSAFLVTPTKGLSLVLCQPGGKKHTSGSIGSDHERGSNGLRYFGTIASFDDLSCDSVRVLGEADEFSVELNMNPVFLDMRSENLLGMMLTQQKRIQLGK